MHTHAHSSHMSLIRPGACNLIYISATFLCVFVFVFSCWQLIWIVWLIMRERDYKICWECDSKCACIYNIIYVRRYTQSKLMDVRLCKALSFPFAGLRIFTHNQILFILSECLSTAVNQRHLMVSINTKPKSVQNFFLFSQL